MIGLLNAATFRRDFVGYQVSIRRADDWAFEQLARSSSRLVTIVSIRRADDWAFEQDCVSEVEYRNTSFNPPGG